MKPREWLIEARLKRGWTREQAAAKARMTVRLYTWLEIDDEIITNPEFIKRLKRLYRLTDDQYNTMVNPKHYIGRKKEARSETEQDKSGVQGKSYLYHPPGHESRPAVDM